MKDVLIVDLDQTLTNLAHRLHFIEQTPKKWDHFYKGAVDDTVNPWCRDLILASLNFDPGLSIIHVTGRSDDIENMTEMWLKKHVYRQPKVFDTRVQLFMRKKGDGRPDTEVKSEIYERHIKGKFKIKYVVEDRAKVVRMWREKGLTVLQCAEGDY